MQHRARILYLLCGLTVVLFSLSHLTLAQGPGETVLYQVNLDGGQAPGWNLEPGWQVVQDGDNWVLAGEGHYWARPGGDYGGDFRVQFRLKLLRGRIHLVYRLNETGRYFISFHEGGSDLNKQYFPDTFQHGLTGSGTLHSLETWHQVEIAGQGATLRFLVDGQQEWEYTDPEPLAGGSFAFETLDDSTAYVDDILVYGPAPTPTPTPDRRFTWVRTGGPLGGLGYDVRMRPDNPDVMYVTDAWAGVHKSTDGGQTWFPANNGITTRTGFSGDAIPVFCLTIDPHNYDTIWVGTQNLRGIFKSTDAGQTWVEKDNGVVEYQGITFRGFTVDPRSSDIIYAAAEISSFVWAGQDRQGREFDMTQGVVYKTTDGGEHWSAIWRGDNLARYIWIDPRNPDVLYVSTGIFDREAANSDKTKNAPGGAGIYKSTDGGQTWRAMNNGLGNLYIGTLFMHPTNPDILLAGAGNNAYHEGSGVYLSTNGGETWAQALPTEWDAVTSVEFAPSDPDIAYAGGDGAVHRSQDGGRTWQRLVSGAWGPPGARVGFPIDFQVDPRDPNRLFANAYGGGNFVSTDGGQTWQVASQGYTGAEMNSITVDPTNPATVYAGGRSGFFKSTAGGADWQPINFAPAEVREGAAAAIDPSNPLHVLISDQQEGHIWTSDDGGRHWQAVVDLTGQLGSLKVDDNNDRMQGVNTIVFAPSNPHIIYAGFAVRWCVFFNEPRYCQVPTFGVHRSADSGRTWQQMPGEGLGGLSVLALAVHPTDPDTLYAATGGKGVLKSTDGGQTWTPINNGLSNNYARSLAIDPADSQVIFVGTERAAIFKSTDGGATWKPSAAGMDAEAAIRAVVIDPQNPQVVYAGDWHSGAYRSDNGGTSWVRINEGLRTRAIRGLAISSDGQHLYAATQGEGVFRLDLSGQPPQPAPTLLPPTPVPSTPISAPSAPTSALPTPTAVVAAPSATPPPAETAPPTAVPTPTPQPSGGKGICGGVAALPLALLGLVCLGRRSRTSLS